MSDGIQLDQPMLLKEPFSLLRHLLELTFEVQKKINTENQLLLKN